MGRVVAWLEASGFRVESTARSRTRLSFTGTVAQITAAFGTEMRRYAVAGETHVANASEVSVPSDLSGLVLGVRNLSDFRLRPRGLRVRKVSAEFTSSVSGQHYLAPDDFATI